jgi:hypothetical protein
MHIPVLIEPIDGAGYRASGGGVALVAEGMTREEALQRLRQVIQDRLAAGQLVQLDVDTAERPWARFAGTWKPDDPFIAEWEKAVEDYRRRMDEDPDVP